MAERDISSNHDTRVLVADGDKESRSAVIWCLLAEGYRVDPVADGFAAAAAMEQPPLPTVAIIDLGLQGFNGRRLIEHLRASPRLRHIPIIATGFVEPFAPLPPGVAFQKKPCDGEQLLTRIRRLGREALTSFFPSRSVHHNGDDTPTSQDGETPSPAARAPRDEQFAGATRETRGASIK